MADLPTQRDFDDYAAWSGRDVLGPGGERLGAVELIFLDEATDVPEWVLVRLDDDAAFVPLAGASVEADSIRVEPARDRVESAPRVDVGETLSVGDEKRLYEHYGLDYSREESSTVLPEGATAEQVEERPRLRKYIGAPVAAPSDEVAAPEPEAEEPAPAPETETETETPTPAAGDMAPRNLSSATPSTLPPPAPEVYPPPGGFQAQQAREESGSRLRTAVPLVLGGALAGLIAVLAYRRRKG